MSSEKKIYKQRLKELAIWTTLAVITCISFVFAQTLVFNLFGYISWTGVSQAAIGSILNVILTGTSIWSAVVAIVGAAAAGPIIALFQQLGISALRQWIRELGFSAVVSL